MKLYKLISIKGDRGVSVFPERDDPMPPPEDLMADPISDMVRQIQMKGYTGKEAYLAIQAWAWHAKHDLLQGARGVRIFCEQCVREIPTKGIPAEPIAWGLIIVIAVIVAVALGLYLWVVLDRDMNFTFGSHEWAYIMRYQESLWQSEIKAVSDKQVGYYEKGGPFGAVVGGETLNLGGEFGRDYVALKPGGIYLTGRRLIFYHDYQFRGFFMRFLGYTINIGMGLYRLKSEYSDKYKPRGFWRRPGGPWGTPEYEGCWKEWWWL